MFFCTIDSSLPTPALATKCNVHTDITLMHNTQHTTHNTRHTTHNTQQFKAHTTHNIRFNMHDRLKTWNHSAYTRLEISTPRTVWLKRAWRTQNLWPLGLRFSGGFGGPSRAVLAEETATNPTPWTCMEVAYILLLLLPWEVFRLFLYSFLPSRRFKNPGHFSAVLFLMRIMPNQALRDGE